MHLLFVILASFILSPNYNAILLLMLLLRCFVTDFKSLQEITGMGGHFTNFVEIWPV